VICMTMACTDGSEDVSGLVKWDCILFYDLYLTILYMGGGGEQHTAAQQHSACDIDWMMPSFGFWGNRNMV
jgi:hypothetical protein